MLQRIKYTCNRVIQVLVETFWIRLQNVTTKTVTF